MCSEKNNDARLSANEGDTRFAGGSMRLADTVLGVAATLRGASDSLSYRAAAEDDDMLALMADVLYAQADVLNQAARRL